MKTALASLLPWLKLHWVAILIGLLALLLFAALAWWVWKRYRESLFAWWEAFRREPEIEPDALTRIWVHFWRRVPVALRWQIRRYPVYVVLGDDRSGKSELIRCCAALDIQANRYHPSIVDADYIRIYLGNESIILELSASFLHANTPDHANALLRLWKRLPSNTHLVLTIDAYEMMHGNEQQQNLVAQALVGKLALFGELNQRPVPYSLVLTHMDRIHGFRSLLAFVDENNFDLSVRLTASDPIANFSQGLDYYAQYSASPLLHCDTRSFVEILNFMSSIKEILATLQGLMHLALTQNSMTTSDLRKVCLISNVAGESQHQLTTNNPFIQEAVKERLLDRLNGSHLRIAASIALVATLYQGFSFWSERTTLIRAAELINEMPAITLNSYAEIIHPTFKRLYLTLRTENLMRRDIGDQHFKFYPEQANRIRREIAKTIRTSYLLPRLNLAQHQDRVYSRTINLLAILHASTQNELGQFYVDDLDPDPNETQSLPQEVVTDYIAFNNDPNASDLVELESKPYGIVSAINATGYTLRITQMLSSLDDMADDPYIDPEKLENLKSVARVLLTRIERQHAIPYFDEKRQWLTQHGHVSPETIHEWERFPLESQIRSALVREALQLLVTTEVEASDVPMNFNLLLKRIQETIEDNKKLIAANKMGVIDVQLANELFQFDTDKWLTLTLRSKIYELLNAYYLQSVSTPGWIFFEPRDHVARVALGYSTDESGVLINNAQVDLRLTREGYEENVKPAIESMSSLIDIIPLQPEDRQRFLDFFVRNLSAYAGHYANAYWGFFRSIIIRIENPDQLITYLKELQRPGSAFVQNLVRVKENVLLDLPQSPNYQPMRDRLEDFVFLKKLMAEQAGTYPELARYLGIVAGLYDALISDEPPPIPISDKQAQASQGLKSILTPLGRVSFDMLTGADGSPLRLTEGWLRDLSIPESWRGPFLAPMLKVREMGRNDVDRIVSRQWAQLWDQQVLPLLSQFPFDSTRGGTAPELAPEALNAIFHPVNGSFWLEIRRIFGVLFVIQDGKWSVRPEVARAFRLPDNMDDRLNAVSDLTLELWDKEGLPKPMNFKVKVDMIPEIKPMANANDQTIRPSLVYLRSGSASALGFNQKSIWQDISMEWWPKGTANVGIEFESIDEKAKKYASLEVSDSRWPLLKLLAQANRAGLSYRWSVSLLDNPNEKLNAGFAFRRDPFEFFSAIKNR